jgi:sterol desaturase/sphingolipid hydroxylase (fatty acid hydroxylase superfamily)
MTSIILEKGPIYLGALVIVLWFCERRRDSLSLGEKIRHSAVNVGIFIGKLLLQTTLGFVIVKAALFSRESQFGLLDRWTMPESIRWILAFVLLDLGGYCLHRLSHEVPLLWRFHRVHHSDEAVDVSTYFRTHPGEALISWIWFVGIVTLVGPPLSMIEVGILLTVTSALFQHADLILPTRLEEFLRKFWITGSLHKIHHSKVQGETDSNFGTLFAFWDLIFRTYRAHTESGQVRYGLEEFSGVRWRSIGATLKIPFS